MSLIVGIDPGTHATGYALLRTEGRKFALEGSGTIRLASQAALHARLGRLHEQLDAILQREGCSSVAVEDIFTHRNARSALLLGHARGVALALAARRGLEVHAYPPASVKRAVGGHGRAEKSQIQQMVRRILGLQKVPAEDEADAIAVALCHAMSQRAALVRVAGGTR